ncbi:MAG: MobA/MobL family protein, partial [Desulfovibrio sp.]|nr:MobA/MobL family protein [Desulfovibrio sp.]
MAEFHLHASLLSVEKGNSASAGYNYIYRLGEHAHRAHELIFCSSGNMPVWAKDDPGLYWASADLYERSNGRLARQIDFAIPIELADQDRINLATAFARALAMSPDGLLPYSYSVHYDDPEHPHNPHCHVLISQRINDGHPRSAETWFRRAAVKSKAPETGGARKTSFDNSEPKAREWLIGIRTKWADMANDALKEAGFEVRIDERSYKAQG